MTVKTGKKQDKKEKDEVIRDEEGKFLKGQTGNPDGRPRGSYSLRKKLIKKVQRELGEDTDIGDKLAEELVYIALADSKEVSISEKRKAIMDIMSMIDGKPKQQVEVLERGRTPELQEQIDNIKLNIKSGIITFQAISKTLKGKESKTLKKAKTKKKK